jgi:hypothetical protein
VRVTYVAIAGPGTPDGLKVLLDAPHSIASPLAQYFGSEIVRPSDGACKDHLEYRPPTYWRITAVDAPRSMEWEDGFLDDQLEPNPAIPPTTMHLTLADRDGGGTLMTIVVGFLSVESMQEYPDMGHRGADARDVRPGRRAPGQLNFVRARSWSSPSR